MDRDAKKKIILGALSHLEGNMTCTDCKCPYSDSKECSNTWEPDPKELLRDVLKLMKEMEPELYKESMDELYEVLHRQYDWYKRDYLDCILK